MQKLIYQGMFTVMLMVMTVALFAQREKKNLTLEDIIKNKAFSSKGIEGFHSMKDGRHFCQLKRDSLNEYEYETGKLTRTIVTKTQLVLTGKTESIFMSGYTFSHDETKILFATEQEEIYRHSISAFYYIYDTRTGILNPLSENGKQRVPAFSHDDSKISFVRDNNIFIRELSSDERSVEPKTGKKTSVREYKVTSDGIVNKIINGVPDWVYEEEFGFLQAYAWSPDGKKIAYYQFDETGVKEYDLEKFGSLYPNYFRYKYPVPGEPNSTVSIHIFDLVTQKTLVVDIGKDTDIYIPRIKWTEDPSLLSLYRMNRHQDKCELMLADASSGKTRIILTEADTCFIEINDHLNFPGNGKEFILSSEKDGFRHIYLYSMDGTLVRQLTKGAWDVTDVYGIDEKKGLVYYQAAVTSPMDRDVYSVGLDGRNPTKLSARAGTNTPEFNTTFDYFINRWSDANTPPFVTLNRASGEVILILQDNAGLISKMKDYQLSDVGFFTFRNDQNLELNACILKPPDFDPLKKYPVLFSIYGGPGSQSVLDSWRVMSFWNRFLAQNGIIIVTIDPRGTASRGAHFKRLTYLQLGKFETEDMIAAAKYLGALPYVDKGRIGVWGWSYGGFMALNCLTRGAEYFSMGVSVAPVSHYKYYDDIYTERFMRTPKENPNGYNENSPISHVDQFKGKLLLVHGMADDNVHPQNSYDFMAAMVAADKQFESQFYPNSNHGISTGKNTSYHLYKRMTDFIIKNL